MYSIGAPPRSGEEVGLALHRADLAHRGRIVLPAGARERRNWSEGTTLIAIETDLGVILTARDELERIVREQVTGTDVVAALLEERRAASGREDDA